MSLITIDLHHDNDPPSGRYITQVRTSKLDKQLIADAAALVGMPMAAFIRAVAVQAATEVYNRLDPHTPEPDRSHGVAMLRGA